MKIIENYSSINLYKPNLCEKFYKILSRQSFCSSSLLINFFVHIFYDIYVCTLFLCSITIDIFKHDACICLNEKPLYHILRYVLQACVQEFQLSIVLKLDYHPRLDWAPLFTGKIYKMLGYEQTQSITCIIE